MIIIIDIIGEILLLETLFGLLFLFLTLIYGFADDAEEFNYIKEYRKSLETAILSLTEAFSMQIKLIISIFQTFKYSVVFIYRFLEDRLNRSNHNLQYNLTGDIIFRNEITKVLNKYTYYSNSKDYHFIYSGVQCYMLEINGSSLDKDVLSNIVKKVVFNHLEACGISYFDGYIVDFIELKEFTGIILLFACTDIEHKRIMKMKDKKNKDGHMKNIIRDVELDERLSELNK